MKTKNELEQAIVMHEEALESSRHHVTLNTQDLEQANEDEMQVIQTIHNYEVQSMCKIIKLKLGNYAKKQLTGLV